MVASVKTFELISAKQLKPASIRWLWPSFLAYGQVTLFPSQTWVGKSTLLTFLVKQMEHGGKLLGEKVARGRVVIVSDEPQDVWEARHGNLEFGDNVRWIVRPFQGLCRMDDWLALIDMLTKIEADLFVFDPLAMMLPRGLENNQLVLEALEYLHLLTDCGAAVLLIHHTPTNRRGDIFLSRGFGGILGFANVLMKMERPKGELPTTYVRNVMTQSKLCSIQCRTVELNDEGTDYKVLPIPADPENPAVGWPVLKTVLEDSPDRLTRREILAQWPEDFDKPSAVTLRRWLDVTVETKLVTRTGDGRWRTPFKYGLVEKVYESSSDDEPTPPAEAPPAKNPKPR